MYRTIGTEIWTDPKFRALPAPGKLLFMYLITNPHAHVCGLYYIADMIIVHETGLKPEAVDTLWDTLSSAGLTWRDKKTELVWVVNMLKRQGRGEKIMRSTANHLRTLHNVICLQDFLTKYPSVKKFYRDRVLKGYPELAQVGIQEQECITSSKEDVRIASGKKVNREGNADRPKKAQQGSQSPHHALFGAFDEGWKAKYGTGYKFAKGKDGAHFKWLLKAVDNDAQEGQRIVQAFLADDDPWIVKRRHPLALLVSGFNKYHAKTSGNAAPVLSGTLDDAED